MRRTMLRVLVACLSVSSSCTVIAVAPPADTRLSTLAARLDAHLDDPRFAAAAWGVKVVSLDTGATLYARHPDALFVPASTAKLFTAALALDTFGPDHRVATSLFATAKPARDGELRGDLVLVGYGDPTLGFDTRTSWADTFAIALRKTGTTRVRGDLIADATWFSSPTFGNGWEAGDLQSWFGVPASALSVDENIVRAFVMPGPKPGSLAKLRFEPEASAPEVETTLTTREKREGSDISLYRAPGDARLHAFGAVAAGSAEQTYRVALHDPALAAAAQLREALARQGVTLGGKLRSVYWPHTHDALASDTLQRIGDIWSPPLSEIVMRGLKVSQNLYLQNLLLLVGRKAQDDALMVAVPTAFRSTENRGVDALRTFLARLGITPDAATIEDGAGLSRRNLTSPSALVTLLVHEGTSPAGAAFRRALPEAGVDGSLTVRMRNTPAQNRVHAKTGSMAHTYSLAGYAETAAGERLAFAILLNQYRQPAGTTPPRRPSAELDAIAIALAELSERSVVPASVPATPPVPAPLPSVSTPAEPTEEPTGQR